MARGALEPRRSACRGNGDEAAVVLAAQCYSRKDNDRMQTHVRMSDSFVVFRSWTRIV
jgi:hypothetical protein